MEKKFFQSEGNELESVATEVIVIEGGDKDVKGEEERGRGGGRGRKREEEGWRKEKGAEEEGRGSGGG